MKRLLVFFLLVASALYAERPPAVKPRANAQDYPAVKEQANFTLGAAQLSNKQVRKAFVSNIGKKYVVVEVAVYPKSDAESRTKVTPQDFALRAADKKDLIHPADPTRMAYQISDKDQKGTNYDIHPVTAIEYSNGPSPDDPYYSNRRGGHVTTTSGVMVDMKSKKKDPKTSDGDRKAMTAELSEKSLPEADVAKPVAGYLYFPVPDDKSAHYQLEYHGHDKPVVIPLPAPAE